MSVWTDPDNEASRLDIGSGGQEIIGAPVRGVAGFRFEPDSPALWFTPNGGVGPALCMFVR